MARALPPDVRRVIVEQLGRALAARYTRLVNDRESAPLEAPRLADAAPRRRDEIDESCSRLKEAPAWPHADLMTRE